VEDEVICVGGGFGGECVERLSVLVLQVDMADRWVWKLHPSHKYTVQSAYSYLTAVDSNISEVFH